MIGVHSLVNFGECLRQDSDQQVEGDNLDDHGEYDVNYPISSIEILTLLIWDFTQHELVKET